MALQTINIGNIANDGTGDDLRVAFNKVNANFTDLDGRVAPALDGANLGSGEGVYYLKNGDELQFKSLVGGNNITLSSDAETITIAAPDSLNSITVNADTGSHSITPSNNAHYVVGGSNIDTSISGETLTITVDGNGLVELDTSPTLGGNLNAATHDISGAGTVTADKFIGDIDGLVYGHDLRFYIQGLRGAVTGADYGLINENFTTGFEILLFGTTIDYGSITSPSDLRSDYGTCTNPL